MWARSSCLWQVSGLMEFNLRIRGLLPLRSLLCQTRWLWVWRLIRTWWVQWAICSFQSLARKVLSRLAGSIWNVQSGTLELSRSVLYNPFSRFKLWRKLRLGIQYHALLQGTHWSNANLQLLIHRRLLKSRKLMTRFEFQASPLTLRLWLSPHQAPYSGTRLQARSSTLFRLRRTFPLEWWWLLSPRSVWESQVLTFSFHQQWPLAYKTVGSTFRPLTNSPFKRRYQDQSV